MPEAASTRLGLVGPSGSDDITLGDDVIRGIIAQLEAVGVTYSQQGTVRPSATAARRGLWFINMSSGDVSYCTGTGWADLSNAGPGSIPIVDLADPTAGKFIGSLAGEAAAIYPPGHEIGYDEITADVNVVSTTEATGTTVITCAPHTFDGDPVMVEFFAPAVWPHTALWVKLGLFEGSTQIGRICEYFGGASDQVSLPGRLRFTPSAGSHTYKITASQGGGGTPQILAGAGGTGARVPAFVRFTKV